MRLATRCLLSALALLAWLVLPSSARGADPRFDPHGLVPPPLRPLPDVRPERVVLGNGAVLFLLEDHTLPRVSGTAYFPASPLLVPDDRVGLASMTGEVMRSGGTAGHPGDALDDRLAALGATIATSLSGEMGYGGFRCLSEDTREVVERFAEVLRRPAFPADKLELARLGMRQAIASRNDEPTAVLFRLANRAAHGDASPWARQSEFATIEPVTREDCERLHARVFVPERMVVAVYGDFRASEMKRLLARVFGDWRRSGTPAPALPAPAPPPAPRLLFAAKEDVTQTGVLVAQPGSRVDDPDHAALVVYEKALGSGFASRLVSGIRTRRGLAYDVGADIGAGYRHPGRFEAHVLTRNDSAMTTLGLLREELARSVEEPFTAEEFAVARDAAVNALVFEFEKPASTLFRAAYYQMMGYPADFLARHQRALAGVTPETMTAAARRHVHPGAQSVVVVGRERDFDRPLESFGLPVVRVDLTIPPPPEGAGAPAPPE